MSVELLAHEIRALRLRIAALEAVETPTPMGARVYNSATISVANGTDQLLTFDSERYDTSGFHSTSSNTSRLTIPTSGYYLIVLNIEWQTVTAGRRQAHLKLNGSTVIAYAGIGSAADANSNARQIVSTISQLAVGDYVEALVFQNSGAAINLNVGAQYSPEFMIQRFV